MYLISSVYSKLQATLWAACRLITMLLFHCRYYSMYICSLNVHLLVHLHDNDFDAQGERLIWMISIHMLILYGFQNLLFSRNDHNR